jgi:phage terminase large subunit GpA-like protein
VTCGVDVQGNRLEVLFLGTAANAERWILDRVVIPGDTSGEAPWRALSDVLGTTFKLEDKRELPISVTFCDAGFNTENVAKFCAAMRQRQHRVWPSFGRAGWDKPAVKEGSKVKGLMRGLIIGVDNLKLNTMKSLTIRDGGPNAIHLPAHLDDDFFAQLASERLTVKYIKGYARHQWEKDPTTRNEALDILVLAIAAAGLVKGRAAPVTKPKGDKPSIADRFAALNAKAA